MSLSLSNRLWSSHLPNSSENPSTPVPHGDYEYHPYKPAIPRAPQGDARTVSGLEARIGYAKVARSYRDISPRLLQFIQLLKSHCERAIKFSSKSKDREKLVRTISVADGALHSYWYGSSRFSLLCPRHV